MLFLSLQSPREVNVQVDGVELRLDYFSSLDKEEIRLFCQRLSLPVIFTLRKSSQGGHFTGPESKRLSLIEDLLTLSPSFIDLEYDTDKAFIKKVAVTFPSTKIIISYHNFEHTPLDLSSLLAEITSPYAYAYKIATMANSALDSLCMLDFIKESSSKKVTGICMGEEGEITRILGPIFGNFIDYATISEGEKTASGQLSVSELFSIYHYHLLNPNTAVYALIGDPVGKSLGYLTHNAIIRRYGWNAVYVRIKVKKEELASFMTLAKKNGFSGLSVTMPLKEEILSSLDCIDSTIHSIGAVNTIHNKGGVFIGFNTDGKGALNALTSKISIQGKNVVLLGAGGAARAIANEMHHQKASLCILNRTKERAVALAQEIGCRGGGLEDIALEKYDIIINATSHFLPIDPSFLIPGTVALEINTMPKMTLFLQEAQKRGCGLVYGYEMFLNQACEQFRIWFHDIEKTHLEEECLNLLEKK